MSQHSTVILFVSKIIASFSLGIISFVKRETFIEIASNILLKFFQYSSMQKTEK